MSVLCTCLPVAWLSRQSCFRNVKFIAMLPVVQVVRSDGRHEALHKKAAWHSHLQMWELPRLSEGLGDGAGLAAAGGWGEHSCWPQCWEGRHQLMFSCPELQAWMNKEEPETLLGYVSGEACGKQSPCCGSWTALSTSKGLFLVEDARHGISWEAGTSQGEFQLLHCGRRWLVWIV